MTTLELRRRKNSNHKDSLTFGKSCSCCTSSARYQAYIVGFDAGLLCMRCAKQWREHWLDNGGSV